MSQTLSIAGQAAPRADVDFAGRLRAALRRRAAYRATRAELSRMSDRDLADIGVLRADIPAIAREAAAQA